MDGLGFKMLTGGVGFWLLEGKSTFVKAAIKPGGRRKKRFWIRGVFLLGFCAWEFALQPVADIPFDFLPAGSGFREEPYGPV